MPIFRRIWIKPPVVKDHVEGAVAVYLILIDQVDEVLAHIAQRIAEAG